jgi:hypothetical protein
MTQCARATQIGHMLNGRMGCRRGKGHMPGLGTFWRKMKKGDCKAQWRSCWREGVEDGTWMSWFWPCARVEAASGATLLVTEKGC